MLDSLSLAAHSGVSYRVTNPPADSSALAALGLSPVSVFEAERFRNGGLQPRATSLLDAPFDNISEHESRFSPGKIRAVFYSAIEQETAQHEWGHWRVTVGGPSPVFAHIFQCNVDGSVFDLRSETQRLPFLVGTSATADYPPCWDIATEAIGKGAQGLLSMSARRAGGQTTPVFDRQALSNEVMLTRLQFTRQSNGDLSVSTVP